jgi:hypothetical protein
MTGPFSEFDEALLDLAWSLWTELGVRGVARHHGTCAVDPEALILFTAALADLDPRLRDESLDCALELGRYLWVSRLKNLLGVLDPTLLEMFDRYAATFNAASKNHIRFPATASAVPWKTKRSHKSALGDFAAPSLVMLRMRALFGVNARADTLTTMLCAGRMGWFATDVGAHIGFAKRVVSDALTDLARSGILRVTAVENRLRFDFVRYAETAALVGELPAWKPMWPTILRYLAMARQLLSRSSGHSEIAGLVAAQKLTMGFLGDLARGGVHTSVPEWEHWNDFSGWLVDRTRRLAAGESEWFGSARTGRK